MLRWLFSLFAWETIRYEADFEIQHNTVSGKFRHRGIGCISKSVFYGPWIAGKPTSLPSAEDLDEINSELEDVELSGVLGPDCVQQAGLRRSSRPD